MLYSKTKEGLVTDIYKTQRRNCKMRNHSLPLYSKDELKFWILNHKNFNKLYENWKKSNFNKLLKPSIDRLDDYKTYSFDNIRLVTWNENFQKSIKDKVSGKNRKQLKAVGKYDLNGKLIKEYYSIVLASKENNVAATHIGRVCRNIRKSAGGFIWKFIN